MFMTQVQVQFLAVYMQLKNANIEDEKLDFVQN
jgi:hypothetical protein